MLDGVGETGSGGISVCVIVGVGDGKQTAKQIPSDGYWPFGTNEPQGQL